MGGICLWKTDYLATPFTRQITRVDIPPASCAHSCGKRVARKSQGKAFPSGRSATAPCLDGILIFPRVTVPPPRRLASPPGREESRGGLRGRGRGWRRISRKELRPRGRAEDGIWPRAGSQGWHTRHIRGGEEVII